MSVKLRELQEKRNGLVTEARGIVDKADAEKRNLSAEEKVQYDKIMSEATELRDKIDREVTLQEEERRNASIKLEGIAGKQGDNSDIKSQAFRSLIMNGMQGLTGEEQRALSAGTDTSGGFVVPPMEWVAQLIAKVKDLVFVESLATIHNITTSTSMGAPSLEADAADPDWTPEVTAAQEETAMGFGRRELTPHPLAKLAKINNKLLRVSSPNAETIVMDRLAYKFGIAKEKGYLLGNGTQQPLGVFTASALGISTGRDVSTDNAATEFTADGLINAKYALKAPYQAKSTWIMHRDGVKMAAKLKDGNGHYLFELSDRPDAPDQLLGRPLKMSEYAPNTFTAGQYVGIIGDFSYYWICNSLALQFQVLKELYAVNNQTGYIGRLESDGMPVLEEAFARVTLGS